MDFNDFSIHFKDISICSLNPDFRGNFQVNSNPGKN